ncbi:MAG TPA: BON domain-containing protein [Ktedonobacterales bacterium]|nr:BON domain-containing protein [Ktedonobacterales bacterium]
MTNYVERGGRTEASLDLRLAPGELTQYSPWMPDAAIRSLAEEAVDRAVLSPRARHTITLEVHSGRVSLYGRVEIASHSDAAIHELEQTPGVVDVANYLLIDESLQDAVEQALAEKGITGVRALAEHGLISLHGEAPDSQTRFKAQDIAARVTGVRGVVNRLEVRQQI